MSGIRFLLEKESCNGRRYSYIMWTLSADERTLLKVRTMPDGREVTLCMAARGIKPLRNCRRWPVKRDSMMRFMKKELAVRVASLDNIRISDKVYEYLKENYKKIFAGDDYDI